MPASRFLRVESSEGDHPVTPLELLFDLVFVFAITNVTGLMAHELTGRGMRRGLVVIALLWRAWCSYAWLGNQARADEGIVRAGLVTAMGAMFLVALAIPHSLGRRARVGTVGRTAPGGRAQCRPGCASRGLCDRRPW